jgi:AraC-like DNA-binding protein
MRKDYVELLLEYIRLNIGVKRLSLKEAQKFIGCSRSILTDHCKKELGMAPGAYIRKYKALVMINSVEKNNFYNSDKNYAFYSGFCRAFKKIKGMTPAEYKKINTCDDK